MRINRPKGGSLRVAGGAMSLAGGSRRNMLPRRLPSYF